MNKQNDNQKILISAFIGSKNLGDEAIFRSILDNIESKKEDITVLTVNEEKTREFEVNTLYAKSIKSIIKGIRSCDVMLLGGGGIIQDQSSILNFLFYAFQLYVTKRYHKPVILCFAGVGPIKFTLSKWLMKKLVTKSVDYAIVRDKKSKDALLKYGMLSSKVYQAHDPVLNFSFEAKELKNPYTKEKPYVAVALRRWFFANPFLPVFMSRPINKLALFRRDYNQYMTKLAADLDEYLNKHPDIQLVLVSFYDGEDDVVNDDLLALMKNKKQVIIAEKNMDELQYLAIIKDSLFIIGMRLHSLILGSTLAKPFVALRYSSKVDEFARKMGMNGLSMHVEEYDSKQLQKSLDTVTENYSHYEAVARDKLLEYQKKNKQAFKLLHEKIKSLT